MRLCNTAFTDPGRRSRLGVAAVGLALGLGASPASAQSFDCAAASNSVERAICASGGLQSRDTEMAELYAYMQEIADPAVIAEQRRRQREWLGKRNAACRLTEVEEMLVARRNEARECLNNQYRTRINELEQIVPAELSPQGGVRAETDGLEPKVCIYFNGRVGTGGQSVEAFFEVEPAVAFGVESNYYDTCLTGFAFGETYEIKVLQGLSGRSGNRQMQTRRDFNFELKVPNRNPNLRFATNAHIVTRAEFAGIPFESVNVKNVTARILHVDDADILATLPDEAHNLGSLDYPPSHLAARLDQVAWAGTVRTGAELNETYSAALPLAEMIETLRPGIYLAALHGESLETPDPDEPWRYQVEPVYHWFSVSDVGAAAYQGADGLTVTARDVRTLEPLNEVGVSLVSEGGETLAKALTDANGVARIEAGYLRGENENAPKRVYVYGVDGDFISLDLTKPAIDLMDRGDQGRLAEGTMDAFVTTERGIYRPGDRIYLTAILSDAEGIRIEDMPVKLRLRRPDGRLALTRDLTGVAAGYQTHIDTPASITTGRWTFEIALGEDETVVGRTFALIEDFSPPRIEVSAEAATEIVQPDQPIVVNAQADFLYGAPAGGLKGEMSLSLLSPFNPFPDHRNFIFGVVDDPRPGRRQLDSRRFETQPDGSAVVQMVVSDLPDTAHPLSIEARVDVFDVGGAPVSETVRVPVAAAPYYLGLRPDFGRSRAPMDQEVTIEVLAVAPDGEAMAKSLRWRIVEEAVDYIWYNQNGRWRYKVIRDDIREVAQGSVSTAAGAYGEIRHTFDDWGDFRIEVEDPRTGRMASHRFFTGWAYNYSDEEPAPDMVRLSVGEGVMQAGGKAVLRIEPPFDAGVTVAIADSTVRAVTNHRIPATGAEVEIDLPAEAVGGVYALVSAYGEPDGRRRHAPTRAVGLIWLPFDMSARTLEAEIGAPEVMEPGDSTVIEVALANAGADAHAVLMVVDDGVLGLTNFDTPDPAKHYYGQRRLGVELRDVYSRFIDAAGFEFGDIVSGGDGAAALARLESEQMSNLPQKTREISAWMSEIVPVENGVATFDYDALNEFDGRVRLMAVVWDGDSVGNAEDTMIIRRPVVADISLPNFLAPGDLAETNLTLHNVAGAPGRYQLALETVGPVSVRGANAISADLAEGERRSEAAILQAETLGDAEFLITVTGPNDFYYQETRKITVRPPAGYESRRLIARLAPGRSLEADPALLDPYFPSTWRMTVGVNPLPDLDVPSIVASLNRYPYGCAEQTVSTALPMLLSERLADPYQIEPVVAADDGMNKAIARLASMQTFDGGFGVWSGNGSSSPWLSVYVMDFLLQAADQGYDAPEVVIERGVEFLQELARGGRGMSDQISARAYAFYVLARAGAADAQQLRRFNAVRFAQIGSTTPRAHIAAALALIGDATAASNAFKGAASALPREKVYYYFSYGTRLREYAALVSLMAESGAAEWDLIHGYAQDLSLLIRSDAHLSTQESAWALRAAAALLDAPAADVALDVDGARIFYASTEPYLRGGEGQAAAETPRITNAGDTALYGLISFGGVLREAPPAEQSGFVVRRTIRDRSGAVIDPEQIEQNQLVVVVFEGAQTDPGRAESLLVDFLPAGLEIQNALTGGVELQEFPWLRNLTRPEHTELRSDRFVAAMNLDGGERFKVAYIARAITSGQFDWAGAVIEDMYQPERFGRAAPATMIVRSDD